MSLRVYLDLEYCFPGMSRAAGRPTHKDLRQVVQIGAIKFNTATGAEEESLNLLVQPAYTKKLPSFFTELTQITQDQVDNKAISFPQAISRLADFIKNAKVYTFDKDWEVLKQNSSYFGIEYPFRNKPFKRVKPLLKQWGLNSEKYSSGTLHQAVDIDVPGNAHDALHDVRSMALSVHYFESTKVRLIL